MKSRFHFLLLAFLLPTSAAFALTASPATTDGPYYPFNSSQTLPTAWLVGADNDMTLVSGSSTRASGTRMILSGTVVNTAGTPISGAVIELWEADNNGVYYHSGNSYSRRDTNFQSYGTCTTDSSGTWAFRTVRPGLYTGRIRHFHYKVNVNGSTVLISQFMFEADRSSFSSDGVSSPLVSNGTIELTVLNPTSGVDSVDNATALFATKQIVVNSSVTTATSGGTGSTAASITGTGTTTTTTTTTTVSTPSGATVTTGHDVSITATSTGSSHQWQVSSNNGSTWSNLSDGSTYSGTATGTLTISGATTTMNGNLYRVVVNGSTASTAVSLTVVAAYFPYPAGIAIDSSSNLYVADSSTHVVSKVTSAGAVTALAGTSGSTGTTDALGTSARFNQPNGAGATTGGIVYVADTANATLRRIATDGTVTTLAGSTSIRGNTDGTGTAATFAYPVGVTQDASGNLYVADATNHTVRKVTPSGVVTTFAGGAGISGTTDGTGTAARFNYPTGVAADTSGNVYVADTTNNTIRRITSAGAVTTLAGVAGISGASSGTGSAALFSQPGGLALDSSGNLYVADTGNSTIRKVTSAGVVTTLAGLSGVAGLMDGTGTAAWFNQPKALVLDSAGNVYVADTGNAAIRRVSSAGVVTTVSLSTGSTSTTSSTTTSTTTGTTISTNPTTAATSGGGGAPSGWFLGALSLLALGRRCIFRRQI